jgi:hypothetical protein
MRSTAAWRASGVSGAISVSLGGGSRICFWSISRGFLALKGRVPAIISKSMTPNAY